MTERETIAGSIQKLLAVRTYLEKYRSSPLKYVSQLVSFSNRKGAKSRRQLPEDSVEKAKATWYEAVRSGSYTQISTRTVRILCSVSNIAQSEGFIEFLEQRPSLTPTMIRSLVGIYHLNWNNRNEPSNLENLLQRHIEKYEGHNNCLSHWRQSRNLIIGNTSPSDTADFLFPSLTNLETVFESLYLDSTQTPFGAAVILHAASKVCKSLDTKTPDRNQWSYLLNNLLDFESLHKDNRQDILTAMIQIVDNHRGQPEWLGCLGELKDYILQHRDFGDPRTNPVKWDSVDKFTQQTFIAWLSEEDLKFFFELIIKRDPHSRKSFWLNYVRSITNSSVIIGDTDRTYHRSELDQLRHRGRNFSHGTGIDSSAFIMTFGKYVVVEFSEVGNACYVYQTKDFEKLFGSIRTAKIDLRMLKEKQLAIHSQAHYQNWPTALAGVLSTHGINAKS
jgi:hypothetical protein